MPVADLNLPPVKFLSTEAVKEYLEILPLPHFSDQAVDQIHIHNHESMISKSTR
jgi:hypothetical protein